MFGPLSGHGFPLLGLRENFYEVRSSAPFPTPEIEGSGISLCPAWMSLTAIRLQADNSSLPHSLNSVVDKSLYKKPITECCCFSFNQLTYRERLKVLLSL
jgi:hypothetical protein